jgi:drug/metabolite transporter (DMT)-like permease
MYPEIYARKLEVAVKEGKIVDFKKHIILFCTISNIIANTFQNISLNFIAGSVYQMTRGGTIATTLFFSIFYLKNKAKRHQIVGSSLAILGVVIVGISNVIYSKSSKSADAVIIAICRIINTSAISY